MTTMPGYILITADGAWKNWITAPEGTKFFVDTEYDPEQYRQIIGRVMATCDESADIGMAVIRQWTGEVEVVEGDLVYFHYRTCKPENAVLINGETCWRLPLTHVICVVRDGIIHPTCGNVLLTPIEERTESKIQDDGLLVIPETSMQRSDSTGVVAFLGKRETGEQIDSVSIGDKIAFRDIAGHEYEIEGKPYLCMREQDIFAIL